LLNTAKEIITKASRTRN